MEKKLYIIFLVLLAPGILPGQDKRQIVYLYPNGAPGFESRKNEPEQAKDWWVKNIHNPSLTVYLPPKEKANGSAVIICPGGGHRELVFTAEGEDAAEYFNNLGVTAFVLKYRLFREENSPYKQEHTLQDGRRAMRLVRQQAAIWKLDTNRIGLMGFSAGGELAGWVAFNSPNNNQAKGDSIDKVKCKPDFLILVYPGPLAVPDTLLSGAPPLFMIAANDDECCSEPVIKLLQLYRKANIKTEVHLYEQGSHAFNMGKRSSLKSINTWPQRMADWLSDNAYLHK
ncbi:MAG: alpha/beta hydrolase [Bacteroidota bacterium]|nr:alpha/beta hydrolase [Bacteroidota bacterium]